jgi:hypothetical protein
MNESDERDYVYFKSIEAALQNLVFQLPNPGSTYFESMGVKEWEYRMLVDIQFKFIEAANKTAGAIYMRGKE